MTRSCGEQVKLFSERQLLTAGIFRLLFAQHRNQLDPTQDHGFCRKFSFYLPILVNARRAAAVESTA